MAHKYISRILIANRGHSDERVIAEAEIRSIDAPVAILGDPGSGKTELTKLLERQFGYLRIAGGTFYRNQNIRSCIGAVGADPSAEATASLARIVSAAVVHVYSNEIHHARAQQLRIRRDTEFLVPTFGQVKQTLSNGLPGSIDDLKAMIMDRFELLQDYFRNSDTNAWDVFWNNAKPKNENTCRDRLLDQLRPRLPVEINLLPETVMPEASRADIVVIYRGYGVPIEIKGQWHSEVWNAANVQLIEKYARDWRADDRGIYLVLWFGDVPGKNLPRPPGSSHLPSSPAEFREMLVARLVEAERARIDVFVLDVSKPSRPS